MWLPVESNPVVLTGLLRRLGVPEPWGVSDVLGLDPELLCMVPQPCVGLVLLFPSTSEKVVERRSALAGQKERHNAPETTFFMQQFAADACGTIALIHCVLNADIDLGSPLSDFLSAAKPLDPTARGRLFLDNETIRALSNDCARAGESDGAGSTDNQGQHFVAFVQVDGVLLELDGRNQCDGIAFPVVHGPTTNFLADAAKVIQSDFILRDSSNLHFSVLALCHLDDA